MDTPRRVCKPLRDAECTHADGLVGCSRTAPAGRRRSYDGAKRLNGRKRHLLVDTTSLVLLAGVHAADLHDCEGA